VQYAGYATIQHNFVARLHGKASWWEWPPKKGGYWKKYFFPSYTLAMELKAYEITAQRLLEEIPAESLSSAWYEDETHRWLDIEGGEPEALRELLAPFELHPLVLEACTEPGGGGQFAAYEKELYIEIPVLTGEKDGQLTSISIICLPTTLLTIHDQAIPAMEVLVSDLSGHRRLHLATTSGLLYNMFDYIADRLA
jgi:Mg2+ and Co2+ transporter CorA